MWTKNEINISPHAAALMVSQEIGIDKKGHHLSALTKSQASLLAAKLAVNPEDFIKPYFFGLLEKGESVLKQERGILTRRTIKDHLKDFIH